MADQTVYALLLRPVGQLLEALRIESFSLSVENEDLVVRDKTPGRKQITPRAPARAKGMSEAQYAELLSVKGRLRILDRKTRKER